VAAQRREPSWDVYQTTHYKILHSCSKIEATYLGNWMEFVYKAYTWMIKPRTKNQKRFTIKLYRDRKEFISYGNPEGAGAYYVPRTHLLCGFYDREAVFPFFAHEGTHQFVHMAIPKMMTLIPTWFNEGLADCMGSSRVIKKRLHICRYDAMIGKGRCHTIQTALREGKALSFEKLFALTHRDFMKDATLHYAQSWSFVHFLFCYPKVEHSRAIPNGRYRPAVTEYFENLRREVPHAEAWAKALAKIKKTAKELETEWKDYVLNTLPGPKPDDPFVGVGTRPHRRGGVEVMRLVPGAPAEKSGLLVGDRIIYFDKKKVKDRDHFIALIKKRKPHDEVEIVVVRNRKTQKIKLVLGLRSRDSK
jgi:hypothetical protein